MLDIVEDPKDVWLIFEICQGMPLNKLLYSTRGEFLNGERIYDVIHNCNAFEVLEANEAHQFKRIIKIILTVLDLFSQAGFVHCDLKPENILVDLDYENQVVRNVKVIDLGSAVSYESLTQVVDITTPEYMPPEILELIENKKSGKGLNKKSLNRLSPWSTDIWSLAMIMLECVIGFPMWMSYKGRIVREYDNGKRIEGNTMVGMLGVTGRIPGKIIKLQQ